jgi:hypothetical protein
VLATAQTRGCHCCFDGVLEAQACRYTAVGSKGGQMSKLPSALGTNLLKESEMKESCEVYAVPK